MRLYHVLGYATRQHPRICMTQPLFPDLLLVYEVNYPTSHTNGGRKCGGRLFMVGEKRSYYC
jgi:hypothetical protein